MDDNQIITIGPDDISGKIYEVRGQKVMIDRDLAQMYGVGTRDLNKAVKRNIERFPIDFMFQLTKEEWTCLMFQIGTSKAKFFTGENKTSKRGGTQKLPHVFTEEGVAMLSGVLHSERAVQVNIRIMRAFVAVRRRLPLVTSAEDIEDLRSRVRSLEAMAQGSQEQLSDVRQAVEGIYEALNRLQEPSPPEPLPPVGFRAIEEQRRKQE